MVLEVLLYKMISSTKRHLRGEKFMISRLSFKISIFPKTSDICIFVVICNETKKNKIIFSNEIVLLVHFPRLPRSMWKACDARQFCFKLNNKIGCYKKSHFLDSGKVALTADCFCGKTSRRKGKYCFNGKCSNTGEARNFFLLFNWSILKHYKMTKYYVFYWECAVDTHNELTNKCRCGGKTCAAGRYCRRIKNTGVHLLCILNNFRSTTNTSFFDMFSTQNPRQLWIFRSFHHGIFNFTQRVCVQKYLQVI